MRYFYSLMFCLALPFVFMRLLWRSLRVPANRQRWLERVGIFDLPGIKPDGLWVHAVSVGEVVAAIPLIHALRAKFPDLNLTVTTMTATGSQRLRQSLGNTVNHVYMPYDVPFAINGFLDKVKAKCLIIMETELWPNLFHICKSKNIPIIIANGRISDRSFELYMKINWFMQRILQDVSCVAAQSKLDAERFSKLGLAEDKLRISGNLKFEVNVSDEQRKAGLALKHSIGPRLVWVVASTHASEEELIISAFRSVEARIPNCLLILVPRHPDRFNEVIKILDKHNLSYVCRSKGTPCRPNTEILLGDTMGEMNIFYAAADVAFVAGSFLAAVGGHNVLEPVALGVPTLTGPHMSNFKEISNKLQKAEGLYVINNAQELATKVIEWLELSSDARKNIGARGQAVIEENRGAINNIMQIVTNYLPSR